MLDRIATSVNVVICLRNIQTFIYKKELRESIRPQFYIDSRFFITNERKKKDTDVKGESNRSE